MQEANRRAEAAIGERDEVIQSKDAEIARRSAQAGVRRGGAGR